MIVISRVVCYIGVGFGVGYMLQIDAHNEAFMISLELFISSKNGRVSKTISAIFSSSVRWNLSYTPPVPATSYESRLQPRQSSAVEEPPCLTSSNTFSDCCGAKFSSHLAQSASGWVYGPTTKGQGMHRERVSFTVILIAHDTITVRRDAFGCLLGCAPSEEGRPGGGPSRPSSFSFSG
jgi:hypothetical protein